MKLSIKLFIPILLTLNSYAQENGGGWFRHFFDGTIEDIDFIDEQTGFLSINMPNFEVYTDRAFILKTIDGGHSWDPLPAEFQSINNISVINENIIWAGTELGVYKTLDGGETWTNYNPTREGDFFVTFDYVNDFEVSFFDSTTGYVSYNDNQLLLKTNDGGQTWTKVERGPNYVRESSISIVNNDLIFDLTNDLYGYLGFFKSTDGGQNWSSINIPQEFEDFDDIHRIKFINDQDGFILDDQRNYFYKTTDSGQTWVKIEANYTGVFEEYLFVSKDEIYTFINYQINKYESSTNTWNVINEELATGFRNLHYTNDNVYLTEYSKSNLFRLDGNNITQLIGLNTQTSNIANYIKPNFDGENYNCLLEKNYFNTAENKAYAYLNFDKKGKSSKYVETNLTFESGNDYNIIGLIGSPTNEIEISYPQPFKKNSTDNYNWEQLWDANLQTTNYSFSDIKFLDESNILACNTSAEVYKSSNAGNTWELVYKYDIASPETTIRSFSIINENEFQFLNRIENTYNRTTDGGQNWTTIELPEINTFGTGNLSILYNFNNDVIWAYGEAITVLKSTDKGLTWVSKEFDGITQVKNITFINENEGVLSTLDKVYYTNDGGENWVLNNGDSIGYYNVYAHFSDSNTGWLWHESDVFKFLRTPSIPSITNSNALALGNGNYNIIVNWSSQEYATHYKVILVYNDPFENENIAEVGITSSTSYTFQNFSASSIPFLGNIENLKVRVIAHNYQNDNLQIGDNLTEINEDLTLFTNNLELEKEPKTLVYPNPVVDKLHINSKQQIKQCTIYNLTGESLETITSQELDISNIKTGLYILEIVYKNKTTEHFKILKQ